MPQDATYKPIPTYPSPIPGDIGSRNGLPPRLNVIRRAQQAQNHILAFRKKFIFSKTLDLQNIRAGATGAVNLWRCMFHTGYGTTHLLYHVGMAVADGGTDPKVHVSLKAVGGATTTSDELRTGRINSGASDVPNEFSWGEIKQSCAANQEYELTFIATDYARPFSLTIYEVGDVALSTATHAYAVHDRLVVGGPIIDDDIEHLLKSQLNTWKKNGAHVFSWVAKDENGVSGISTATAKCIWDYTNVGPLSTDVNYNISLACSQRPTPTFARIVLGGLQPSSTTRCPQRPRQRARI